MFENSQKGSSLAKRGKIKMKKMKDPTKFENSQKVGDLGKRVNIR